MAGRALLLAGLLAVTFPAPNPHAPRAALPYTPGHGALAGLGDDSRPVESRLTGGFGFAPWRPPETSSPAAPDRRRIELEAEIESAGRASEPTPLSRATRAIVALERGRPEDAIESLQSALAEDPDDPRFLSDLSAAYLEKARRGGGARALAFALESAERATLLAPSLPEAAFNRALALEHLRLSGPAVLAWERVIDLDPRSGWAVEARSHLESLRSIPTAEERWSGELDRLEKALDRRDDRAVKTIVDRNRQPVRRWIEEELLGNWGAGGEPTLLDRARDAADALAAVGGDRMARDAVAAIDRAGGARRAALARGHRLYALGRKLHDRKNYRAAGAFFRQAATAFDEGGSPFAAWPRLYLAIHTYHTPDLGAALADLLRQERSVDAERYPVLSGYVHWMLAQVRGRYGPLAAALPDCQAALRLFDSAGDGESRASMESMLGRAYGETGDLDRAWTHHAAALAGLDDLRYPSSRENLLFNAIATLRTENKPLAAIPFADQMVELARREGDPTGLAVTRRQRGEILADLGLLDEAVRELDAAWTASGSIENPGNREVVRGELSIARGRALCASRPEEAITALTEATAFLTESGVRHRRIEALRERARCQGIAGHPAAAAADLRDALREVERQRGLLHDPELRRFYLDQSRGLLEEWVENRIAAGSPLEPLATVERLRAPLLIEALGSGTLPSTPGEIARALPKGVAVVELLVLDDGIATWVLRDGSARFVFIPVERGELTQRVHDLGPALEGKGTDRISGLLLPRLLPEVEGAETLVWVPDGPLHAVPFAALEDPETGRRLAQDFAVGLAPSARVHLALASRTRRSPGAAAARPATALTVGGVPFPRDLFPELSLLPGSEKEADVVASFYPRATRLLGAEATPERVLDEIPAHEVVFLAVHAAAISGSPELSSLLLAPSAEDSASGLLPAGDIRFDRPVSTRVAVLAACRTARGAVSPTEGSLDLARPFLAAGVPAVVATLWDLDEEISLAFSRRFHAAYAAGADPLTAFHEAQLALMADPDPDLSSPKSWAGLVYLGAAGEPSRLP